MQHLEDNLQKACVTWFRLQYPGIAPLLFAIPNGGRRNAREAARLKSQGVTPGVPDLFLAIPIHGSPGCFFELKVGKNTLTESQKQMHEMLNQRGYICFVIRSLDEFMNTIREYFK
jgi:hypothetical protein